MTQQTLETHNNSQGRGAFSVSVLFRGARIYVVIATLVVALLCMPVIALVFIASSGDLESFGHIANTILPSATFTTVMLLAGVAIFVSVAGTLTAWLVSFYTFPFRNVLQWMLMLPLAIPTYISSYAFVEFFSYTGPLQSSVRNLGGFQNSREYWFPEIRSLTGTILVMGLVLYPYVYLAVRTLFRFQGSNIIDSARVLGSTGARLFFKVTLPLARPAIILGVSLSLMETLNDIGAVEHMGTQTLTFSIFSIWLNQNDLAGAAQIALLLLCIVIGLLLLERFSRGGRKFHTSGVKSNHAVLPVQLAGSKAAIATFICALPVTVGFGIPVYILGSYALTRLDDVSGSGLISAFGTSLVLAGISALVAILIALFLSYAVRINGSKILQTLVRLSSSGYAVPGTLVALGIFLPLAMFDNFVDGIFRSTFGIATGLLITGSGAALIFAYVVRFMAMAEGTLSNGFSKVSTNIDMASMSLGRTRRQTLKSILLPIMSPAIAGAGLLVFVEVIKELSATIMLRPFGMNTLATHVYDYASQARVEDAAIGCLLIVAAGVVPVVVLLKAGENKDETSLGSY